MVPVNRLHHSYRLSRNNIQMSYSSRQMWMVCYMCWGTGCVHGNVCAQQLMCGVCECVSCHGHIRVITMFMCSVRPRFCFRSLWLSLYPRHVHAHLHHSIHVILIPSHSHPVLSSPPSPLCPSYARHAIRIIHSSPLLSHPIHTRSPRLRCRSLCQ